MTAKRIFLTRIRQTLGILALSATLGVGSVLADTLEIKGDAPQSYTVVKGDTLWDISGKYLEKPWRWPELWEGNPQIVNPHLIYPGDTISLYYVDGKPQLGINRAHGLSKLSPKIRSTPLDDAIPVLPLGAVQQFILKLNLLDKATIDSSPYVIRGEEGRIVATQGHRIYVKGLSDTGDKNYQIYHPGDPINDPATGQVIGYESIFAGDATLDKIGDPSTLLVNAITREITVGDIALPRDKESILTDYYPKVPDKQLDGQILDIIGGTGIFGRFQSVVINLGTSDGLERGHVLSVFNKGETVLDTVSPARKDTVTLPDERSGSVIVVDAYENLSYAFVVESRQHMRVLDEIRTPE
jgi:hypothetical protein